MHLMAQNSFVATTKIMKRSFTQVRESGRYLTSLFKDAMDKTPGLPFSANKPTKAGSYATKLNKIKGQKKRPWN